jgi:hypothetical protein
MGYYNTPMSLPEKSWSTKYKDNKTTSGHNFPNSKCGMIFLPLEILKLFKLNE